MQLKFLSVQSGEVSIYCRTHRQRSVLQAEFICSWFLWSAIHFRLEHCHLYGGHVDRFSFAVPNRFLLCFPPSFCSEERCRTPGGGVKQEAITSHFRGAATLFCSQKKNKIRWYDSRTEPEIRKGHISRGKRHRSSQGGEAAVGNNVLSIPINHCMEIFRNRKHWSLWNHSTQRVARSWWDQGLKSRFLPRAGLWGDT